MHLLKAFPFVITGALAVAGCGKAPPFELGVLSDNQTALTDRRYRVFLPSSYNQNISTPVILSYHGANRQIEDQVALDGLTTSFFNEDYIVVYLQGNAVSPQLWDDHTLSQKHDSASVVNTSNFQSQDNPDRPEHTTWEGAPGNESDDYGFTAAVLDDLESSLCIDTNRIYATGKSQGGGFVGRLACHPTLSKRIAAFAPVSGAYYIRQLNVLGSCEDPAIVEIFCQPGREAIPIMAFHGGADPSIKYHGEFQTYCLPSVRHWAQTWVQRNGLNISNEDNSTIDGSDNGISSSWGDGLVNLVYDGDDIKHDWPSLLKNADNKGGPKAAFNATGWIVEFFGRHSLPVLS